MADGWRPILEEVLDPPLSQVGAPLLLLPSPRTLPLSLSSPVPAQEGDMHGGRGWYAPS